LTASKICCHHGSHLGRPLLQELEPVTEGLLILATAAERGAGREYGANEPISIEIFFVRCAALLVMAML
jgi:hypothetical protein